jgi:hypothetical protein
MIRPIRFVYILGSISAVLVMQTGIRELTIRVHAVHY